MEQLVKAKDAATALGMGIGSLYRLARTGKISGVYSVGPKLSGLRFDLEEIRLSLRRPVKLEEEAS